jgi:hypothetical protein
MPISRATLRKYGKRAGTIGLAWLALELLAGAATVAFGASWLSR